ncbi:hypothetical protein Q1695_002150 [Nippostrongylus brasiliensis]|nr:hypothetical protein Q1695_002150 [Nippostrongylus brasiliensis]
MEEAGLIKATLGQFLGYECSGEFYHCRWQSDGFRTYRKHCKTGLVYDVIGTQNCNYDYNVKSCGIRSGAPATCNSTSFHCSLSDQCVPLSSRCDGRYDCPLEEDEQNCPLCLANEFACVVSEQCIEINRRCNGFAECSDGTDETNCEVCGNGLFHCAKSGECILNDERCDGKRHCPHGEDEMLCKKPAEERMFECQSRSEHVPMAQVCDGIAQCRDGSDELYCEMGVGAGHAAESSIAFSSNPSTTADPAAAGDYDSEYEEIDENKPSFPMLSLKMPVAPTFEVPVTTRAPQRIAPIAKHTPWASSGTMRREQTTAEPSTLPPTPLITTEPPPTAAPKTTRTPFTPPAKAKVHAESPSNRYGTRPVQEKAEPIAPMAKAPVVRPRNEEPKLLFAKHSSSAERDKQQPRGDANANEPVAEVVHEVLIAPTTSVVPVEGGSDSKAQLLKRLGGQLSGQVSPKLLSKIEKLLTDELESKLGHAQGTSAETSAIHSRTAPVASTSIVRQFTSRVQKMDEKM